MSRHFNTQDKYILKDKVQEKAEKNEIRIGAGGITASYIRYAANLFADVKEGELYTVVIKGSGAAISKACIVAEILRHRIKGLAQIIRITNNEVTDEYDPIEEGLSAVVIKRKLTVIEIKLTTEKIDGKDILGFQAPLPDSEIKEFNSGPDRGEYEGSKYLFLFFSPTLPFSIINFFPNPKIFLGKRFHFMFQKVQKFFH